MQPRTYLFVPGNRPERFTKAFTSGADAVILDLEDAVAREEKAGARRAIANWFATASDSDRARTVIRINDVHAGTFGEDIALLQEIRAAAVVLPKTESPDQVGTVRNAVPSCGVLALIESARGVAMAHEVAKADGVACLVFGTLDYALDLDIDIAHDSEGLVYAAGTLAVASRAANLAAPVAGVTPQLNDEQRLVSDLAWARRHGFGSKLCIHPKQVAPIHNALAPAPQAVEWARRVLAADAASPGAAQLDGRMIDRPVVLQAQRTLQHAGHPTSTHQRT
jgi:citrate lyase subunit beta / citryl-CoA lyase